MGDILGNTLAINYINQSVSEIIANNEILKRLVLLISCRDLHKNIIKDVLFKINSKIFPIFLWNHVEKFLNLKQFDKNYVKKKRKRS